MALKFLFRSSLKLGIVGGAAYGTVLQGLWSDAQTSKEGFHKILAAIPKSNEYLEKIKIKIPIDEYMNKSVREYWNSGVLCAFYGISIFPSKISHYSKLGWDKAYQTISESIK